MQSKFNHVSCSSCADVVVPTACGVDNDRIPGVARIQTRLPAVPIPSTWLFLFRRFVFKELDRAGDRSCVRLYQEITIHTPKEIYKEISLEAPGIH